MILLFEKKRDKSRQIQIIRFKYASFIVGILSWFKIYWFSSTFLYLKNWCVSLKGNLSTPIYIYDDNDRKLAYYFAWCEMMTSSFCIMQFEIKAVYCTFKFYSIYGVGYPYRKMQILQAAWYLQYHILYRHNIINPSRELSCDKCITPKVISGN